MSRRFYFAWLGSVLLALLLPVALPYAIWPPARFDKAEGSGDCGSIAKDYAAGETTRAASTLWPMSARVERCEGTLADADMQFEVVVRARGPYGIPFASGTVTRAGTLWEESTSGALFGLLALLAGACAVSLPCAAALINVRVRAMRPGPA
jgi:hypothetical protein